MIFISKKKFEQKIIEEVNRRCAFEPHILVLEVEVGDMPEEKIESYLEKIKEKLEARTDAKNFVLIPTKQGVGHINVTCLY